MLRIFIILTIFIAACDTTSKMDARKTIAENNKDVLILSTIIRDHFKRTHEEILDLKELVNNDTLKRISSNFEKLELRSYNSCIAVYFTFSKTRQKNNIELTAKENEMLTYKFWKAKDLTGQQYDGEIRFAFGEQLYHITRITVGKE